MRLAAAAAPAYDSPRMTSRFTRRPGTRNHPVAPLRLLAVLAHPDDESLGFGGTLARYAAEGVETFLLTATRGEAGRCHGHARGAPGHPGPEALGRLREAELRAAAAILGVRDVTLLDYHDQLLDQADAAEAVALVARHIRRVRPHVVVTFPPDGAYGHPDHIAISQFTTAAIVAAADAASHMGGTDAPAHTVTKLYFMTWLASTWRVYERAFRKLVARVDGVERQAVPWPDWAVTATLDTREWWPTVWRAICCHESQMANYEGLKDLPPDMHAALSDSQAFYRAFSLVNGGRQREADLFEGIR